MNTSKKIKISLVIGSILSIFLFIVFKWPIQISIPFTSVPLTSVFKKTPVEEVLSTKNIYGFSVDKSAFKKEYFILNFWASWCPPCIEETPSLLRFVLKNSDKYHLFAISQDSSIKDIEDFIKTFPSIKNTQTEILWDDNRNLARVHNIFKLPETLIYSTQSKKTLKISGSINWESPGFEEYIINYFKNN